MAKEKLIHRILGGLFDVVTSRVFTHFIWWLILFAIILLFEPDGYSMGFRVSNALLLVVFYMGLVYFNLLYLIPEYLSQKKIFRYFLLLLLALLIATPIRTLLFYLKFNQYPELQMQITSNQPEQYIASFIIVSLSTVLKIISDWLRQQRKMNKLITQNMQSELDFLRSQVNPHFLFNTLNSLYALTLKKDERAPAIVLKLSEMMRYMLYESNEPQVELSREIKYIENYLDLEKLRHGPNVEINFELKGEVEDQKITPLLFLPFIENCFKHGVNKSLQKSYVYLKIKLEKDLIRIYLRNSIPTDLIPGEEDEKVGGIGLVNARRRLKLLYPGKHNLEIREEKEEYIVNLTLFLNNQL